MQNTTTTSQHQITFNADAFRQALSSALCCASKPKKDMYTSRICIHHIAWMEKAQIISLDNHVLFYQEITVFNDEAVSTLPVGNVHWSNTTGQLLLSNETAQQILKLIPAKPLGTITFTSNDAGEATFSGSHNIPTFAFNAVKDSFPDYRNLLDKGGWQKNHATTPQGRCYSVPSFTKIMKALLPYGSFDIYPGVNKGDLTYIEVEDGEIKMVVMPMNREKDIVCGENSNETNNPL